MPKANLLERSSAENDLGFSMDRKINTSKQAALGARTVNNLIGCVRRTVASR